MPSKFINQKIFIDADSCPSMVRDFVLSFAAERNISVVFAANQEILAKENQHFTMVVCGKEKDAADNYIYENCNPAKETEAVCADDKYNFNTSSKTEKLGGKNAFINGSDLVITRDLLLAERLVMKNTACMNDRGTIFSGKNIKALLKERENDLMYVSMGLVKHAKGSNYNKKEFAAFANSFCDLFN